MVHMFTSGIHYLFSETGERRHSRHIQRDAHIGRHTHAYSTHRFSYFKIDKLVYLNLKTPQIVTIAHIPGLTRRLTLLLLPLAQIAFHTFDNTLALKSCHFHYFYFDILEKYPKSYSKYLRVSQFEWELIE
jgi:hypothetical protein